MYQSIKELPSQVISSLSDDDALAWMNKYNESLGGNDDPSEKDVLAARRNAWYSVKDSPSSYSFCAKATVEAVDKQKELVDLESVRKLMDDYIAHAGPMSWDHSNYVIGTVWGWDDIDTENGPGIAVWGNLFKGEGPVYSIARNAFAKGANKLSVAGDATKEDRECDSTHGCYVRRKMRQLMEIAVTPHPVNTYATLIWKNENALAKSEGITLSMDDMMIHRSEDECPIMRLRNALRRAGVEAHARPDGVFVPCSMHAQDLSDRTGLRMHPVEGGVMLDTPEKVLEDEFRKSFEEGEMFYNGRLIKGAVSEERFKELWGLGLLEEDGGFFRFANSI